MSTIKKPFFHDSERCKGCTRKTHFVDKGGRKEKWLCFGITTSEARKTSKIPVYDNLRLCIKHPPRPIKEKGLFQLNMTKEETKALIIGLQNLL